MKSTLRSIMFIAAAAVTFSACNVEPIETPEESIGTHKVTFLATQDDTKTTMDIHDGVASFSWEEADEKCFYVYENGTLADLNSIEGDIDDNGLMKITAKFVDGATAPFTYTGFFAPTFSTYPQVPSAQTDAGKYDPKADILVAKPITIDVAQGDAPISFQFKRIVAINKMTIRGLSEGETVSSVKITSDKPIAGKYDYTKGEWYNSTDTQITVTASSQANSAGEAVVYFVSAPVDEAMLTITATTTDNKTYSKALAKAITFSEGGVKRFSVTLAASGSHVATFSVNGQATNAIVAEGSSIPFPEEVVAPYGKVFMGWSTVAIEEPQDNVPGMVNTSEEIMVLLTLSIMLYLQQNLFLLQKYSARLFSMILGHILALQQIKAHIVCSIQVATLSLQSLILANFQRLLFMVEHLVEVQIIN